MSGWGIAKLEATGIISSGSSKVFETLKSPDIGLSPGELIEVAVPKPVIGKSKKILATRSLEPVLATWRELISKSRSGTHCKMYVP